MSRLKKSLRAAGLLVGVLLFLAVAGILVLRTDWFADQVRLRIIDEVQRATGGETEIESFQFDWSDLRVDITGFVLRGTEPKDQDPLFSASRISVGLKIISLFRRDIDIALLAIDQPRISIEKDEGGNANLPSPAAARETRGNLVAPIINLAIRDFRLTDGTWRYAARSGALDLSGQNLETSAEYDPAVPGYRLRLGWRQLTVTAPESIPVVFDAALTMTVEEDRLVVEQGRLATEASALELNGAIESFDTPSASFDVRGELAMADLVPPLRLPIETTGLAKMEVSVTIPNEGGYAVEGVVEASGLAIHNRRVMIDKIAAKGNVVAGPDEVQVSGLAAKALGGSFDGRATIRNWTDFEAEGRVAQISLARLMPRVHVEGLAWNGSLSGPVEVRGRFSGDFTGNGDLTVSPLDGGLPLEGSVKGAFDTAAGDVTFEASQLATGTSKVSFSGSLRDGLQVAAYSENLTDLLPAMELFDRTPPDPFPIQLDNGVAQYGGLLSGLLSDPQIAGHIAIGPFLYKDRLIHDAAADFDLNQNRLRLRSVTFRQEGTRLRGEGELALSNWAGSDDGLLSGDFEIDQGSVEQLVKDMGLSLPLEGNVTGTAQLSGVLGNPTVVGQLSGADLSAYGETVDSLRADFRYSGESIQIQQGALSVAGGELQIEGAYIRQENTWDNGALDFRVGASGLRVGRWKAARDVHEQIDGGLEGELSGRFEFVDRNPRLTSLAGELELKDVALGDRGLGNARFTARTQRNILVVDANAALREARMEGNAEWSLQRESPGLGQVEFTNLTIDTLQSVGLFGGSETEIYLDGSFDGEIGFAGPILKPANWRGMAKITRMEIEPTAGERESDQDLTLRNSGSLLFTIEPAKISVMSARLLSSDTDIEVSGTLSYLRRNPWNLHLKGSADLAVLTAFRRDLLAEGGSTVDAVIRGSLLQPQINGRLEFENGSFYVRDVPNGIEQVNGTIVFNRTRATIEKFTSKTGGGSLELGGFIGFGGEDWVYRVQANAKRVRVRYPEGVSTLLDAQLDLTGSSTRSLLSGEVLVTRAAFNPESDFGSMLSSSSGVSGPAGVSNPFLRGMQFDVQITSSANAEIVTSLTRDIEVSAELRLRGSVARPVLLGRLGVDRGEIQFFGNRYDIVQGEVGFFNPVKIEPVITMDLETRIRSYTVMMNFSGPLNKLNFSYRSDPPLQSEEIIALLTVGRTPTYAGAATTSGPADSSYFQSGGSSFLGYALTAPVSSRLQRFFGVSRIKIDPQLTGIENTPETHVTIEQQVSREITLTYVTNLARTQQQIVRMEWNFHPEWSVYAVRDSNGVFGMDFVYRRRFK